MGPDEQPRGESYPQNPYAAPLAEDERRPFDPAITGRTLNPWVSIWTQPRATMRQIVETDPSYMVLPLAALIGIASGLNNATNALDNPAFTTPPPAAVLIVGGVVGGVIAGLLMWLLFSWLWSITARWLGGQATLVQMRAAYAWGSYPTIWTIPFSLLLLIYAQSGNAAAPPAAAVLLVGVIAQMVIGIWSFVVLCKCIGEVSRFSAWRGWGTMILAGLLLVLPIILVAFVVAAMIAML